MSAQNAIPLLREVIHRGEAPSDEFEWVETASDTAEIIFEESESSPENISLTDSFDGDDIEQEYHAALQQIQAEQQEIEFEAPTSDEMFPAKGEITPAQSAPELLTEEQIRMILERHMDKACQEIIKLISHKLS